MITKKKLIKLGYKYCGANKKNIFAIKYYGDEGSFFVIFHEVSSKPECFIDYEMPFMNMPAFKSTDTIKDYHARMAKAVKAYRKDMKELFGEGMGSEREV